jgi:predicted NBD/HSP70 family sugar kinase
MSAGLVGVTKVLTQTGGRPSAAYEFRGEDRHVLVADLGARHATFGVTDLRARVIESEHCELDIGAGPDKVMAEVVERLSALRAAMADPRPVIGVGVGLPGPVEHSTGRPTSPPIMPGWDGYDVGATLVTAFGAPVFVDNDANLLALGERAVAWPDETDLVFVKVASGVGAGLIVGGNLVRGAEGAAGDIGHIYTPGAENRPCRCGNVGCVEAVAGGLSVAAQLTAMGIPAEDASDVVRLARSGNLETIRAIRESGRAIGAGLASCIAVLNPRVIVLGGELSEVGEPLIAGIRESVYRRALPLSSQHLRVVAARSGPLGGVIGAAHMVLDALLDPRALDASVSDH